MQRPNRTLENLARGLAEKNLARSRYMLAAGAAHREGLAVAQRLALRWPVVDLYRPEDGAEAH